MININAVKTLLESKVLYPVTIASPDTIALSSISTTELFIYPTEVAIAGSADFINLGANYAHTAISLAQRFHIQIATTLPQLETVWWDIFRKLSSEHVSENSYDKTFSGLLFIKGFTARIESSKILWVDEWGYTANPL